jgi:competence CoiA-like predicted nuclease
MTDDDTNRPGKRYTCPECGTEVMCTKGGNGRVGCHGARMDLKSAKPLPSSD